MATINPRGDFIHLFIRLYMVAVETFTEEQPNGFALYIVFQALGLSFHVWHEMTHQSCFDPRVNQVRSAFAVSSLVGVLVTAIVSPFHIKNSWIIVTLPSIAVAFILGWFGSSRIALNAGRYFILRWHRFIKQNDPTISKPLNSRRTKFKDWDQALTLSFGGSKTSDALGVLAIQEKTESNDFSNPRRRSKGSESFTSIAKLKSVASNDLLQELNSSEEPQITHIYHTSKDLVTCMLKLIDP
jgi:hypothetical protein